MIINEHKLCQLALERWGEPAQALMIMEECGELVHAVARWLRSSGAGRDVRQDLLAEEIADVEIMCHQARLLVGGDVVDDKKRMKLLRLMRRLGHAGCDVSGVIEGMRR